MQENKSFKGFKKTTTTMTFFILTLPVTFHPKDVRQVSCTTLTWIALDVMNIFSQLAECYRHSIDICALDAMRRLFTSSVICFKQIEGLLKN